MEEKEEDMKEEQKVKREVVEKLITEEEMVGKIKEMRKWNRPNRK